MIGGPAAAVVFAREGSARTDKDPCIANVREKLAEGPADIREAVSDRGRGVRSRGERAAREGAPNHRR